MTDQVIPVNSASQLTSFLGSNSNKPPIAVRERTTGKTPTVQDFKRVQAEELPDDKKNKLIHELKDALQHIPSDDREVWVKAGYALFLLGDDGYHLWIEWSKKSISFNQVDADIAWGSFHATETNYEVVFKLAAKYGWINPWKRKPSNSAITKAINQNTPKVAPNFSWTESFTISEQEAKEISDPVWIYDNLIIQGHLIALPAPPNGGKTTILFEIACQLSEKGLNVIYVNADISASDAKNMIKTARERGVQLLLPEMKAGLSMKDVVDNFKKMNEQNADYSGYVVIFDTYKKMTDVISKSQSKEVLQILRGLTAKGMTIILLSHTNKYKDAEDNDVYEGTGDLRADVDELIYLVPQKNIDGSMTVSTRPDKVRGDFDPVTFQISKDRQVTRSAEHIDVSAAIALKKDIEHDDDVINLIIQKLKSTTKVKRTELVAWVQSNTDIGRDSIIRILERWEDHQWLSTKDKNNYNTITYSIKSFPAAPKPPKC